MADEMLIKGAIGAGSGILGSIFGAIGSYFGLSRRIDKLEQEMERKVGTEACEKCTENWSGQLERMHDDIREILRRV